MDGWMDGSNFNPRLEEVEVEEVHVGVPLGPLGIRILSYAIEGGSPFLMGRKDQDANMPWYMLNKFRCLVCVAIRAFICAHSRLPSCVCVVKKSASIVGSQHLVLLPLHVHRFFFCFIPTTLPIKGPDYALLTWIIYIYIYTTT